MLRRMSSAEVAEYMAFFRLKDDQQQQAARRSSVGDPSRHSDLRQKLRGRR
jgi:hypothetical protein